MAVNSQFAGADPPPHGMSQNTAVASPPEPSTSRPKMYGELAAWWPLLSPPEEYEHEAGLYRRAFHEAAGRPLSSLLELGSGGGSNAFHLKNHYQLTLLDLSPGMLEVSRAANPECEHLLGDMRTVRLGRSFDAVLIQDAICYMTTLADLRRAIETAYVHLEPGGAALFAPDFLRESFEPETSHGGYDGPDGRGLRYLEWVWDPDPADSTYIADYVYALRAPDGSMRTEHDRHLEGLFSRREWLEVLRAAGFEARPIEFQYPDGDATEGFVCKRPLRD